MTRVVTIVLLLAAAVSADVVETSQGKFTGTVTMSDSATIWVVLPLGGTQRLPTAAVRAVSFDDATRYGKFGPPLRALGIIVDQLSSGATPRFPAAGTAETPRPGRAEGNMPTFAPQNQSTLAGTYQDLRRDPAMAGLLSAIVPMLGHAYANDAGTGALFLLAEFTEAALAVLLLGDANRYPGHDASAFFGTACAVAVPITKIWECGDAIRAADSYNDGLRMLFGLRAGLGQVNPDVACGLTWEF